MTSAFDPRIVRLGLQIDQDFVVFEGLDMRIQGQKFSSPTFNSCNVKISNLTRDQRNYVITRASPYTTSKHPSRTPISMTLDVGRQSYGTFRLFEGDVFASTVTQPPDIGVTLRSLTQSLQSSLVVSLSMNATTPLQEIAQQVANLNGLILSFQASPRMISNFSHTGAASKLIDKLQLVGDVIAFVDNKTLVVIDNDAYRNSSRIFDLNINTGMVGVPQATESGIMVQMLVTPDVQVGDRVNLQSKINPAVNGDSYMINSIAFDIANRDNPFFYTLFLKNNDYVTGTS